MAKWAGPASQGCDPAATAYETSQTGTLGLGCVQRDNCSSLAEVVHCAWDGAHDWPEIAPEIIWDFFSKHSR